MRGVQGACSSQDAAIQNAALLAAAFLCPTRKAFSMECCNDPNLGRFYSRLRKMNGVDSLSGIVPLPPLHKIRFNKNFGLFKTAGRVKFGAKSHHYISPEDFKLHELDKLSVRRDGWIWGIAMITDILNQLSLYKRIGDAETILKSNHIVFKHDCETGTYTPLVVPNRLDESDSKSEHDFMPCMIRLIGGDPTHYRGATMSDVILAELFKCKIASIVQDLEAICLGPSLPSRTLTDELNIYLGGTLGLFAQDREAFVHALLKQTQFQVSEKVRSNLNTLLPDGKSYPINKHYRLYTVKEIGDRVDSLFRTYTVDRLQESFKRADVSSRPVWREGYLTVEAYDKVLNKVFKFIKSGHGAGTAGFGLSNSSLRRMNGKLYVKLDPRIVKHYIDNMATMDPENAYKQAVQDATHAQLGEIPFIEAYFHPKFLSSQFWTDCFFHASNHQKLELLKKFDLYSFLELLKRMAADIPLPDDGQDPQKESSESIEHYNPVVEEVKSLLTSMVKEFDNTTARELTEHIQMILRKLDGFVAKSKHFRPL